VHARRRPNVTSASTILCCDCGSDVTGITETGAIPPSCEVVIGVTNLFDTGKPAL